MGKCFKNPERAVSELHGDEVRGSDFPSWIPSAYARYGVYLCMCIHHVRTPWTSTPALQGTRFFPSQVPTLPYRAFVCTYGTYTHTYVRAYVHVEVHMFVHMQRDAVRPSVASATDPTPVSSRYGTCGPFHWQSTRPYPSTRLPTYLRHVCTRMGWVCMRTVRKIAHVLGVRSPDYGAAGEMVGLRGWRGLATERSTLVFVRLGGRWRGGGGSVCHSEGRLFAGGCGCVRSLCEGVGVCPLTLGRTD